MLTTLVPNPISNCGVSSHVDTGRCSNGAPRSAGKFGNGAKAGGNRESQKSVGGDVNGAPAKNGATKWRGISLCRDSVADRFTR